MKLVVITMTVLDDEDDSPMETVSETIGLPTKFTEVHFEAKVVQDANFRNVQVLDVGCYVDDITAYYEGNKQ